MLLSARYFVHDDKLESTCSNILGGLIPQYLVYRSVLRATAQSLEKIQALGLEARIATTGPFRESWTSFNEVASERLAIKAEFDRDPSVHARCDNAQVSESPTLLDHCAHLSTVL